MVTAHDNPEHRCTWACPQSRPLDDIRETYRDIKAGMTPEELEAKHDHGPADRLAVYRELGITDEQVKEIDAFTAYCRGVAEHMLQKGMTSG